MADLNGQIETLAMQLMLGGVPGEEAARALTAISETARMEGRSRTAPAAADLAGSAGIEGAGDLCEGIDLLQRLIEEPEHAPVDSNPLAQDPELFSGFVNEARGHLSSIEEHLLTLKQEPENSEAVHAIFRGFHTIKALAGFLDLATIGEVAHQIGALLDRARNGTLAISPAIIDAVLSGADYLGRMVTGWECRLAGAAPGPEPDADALLARLATLLEAAAPVPASPVEALAALSNATEAAAAADANDANAGAAREQASLRVHTDKLNSLMDLVGELVIAQSMIRHDPAMVSLVQTPMARHLSQHLSELGRITGEVQRTAMSMRMVAIGQLFRR